MKNLFTILLNRVIANHSPEEAAYLLKEILESEWGNLTNDQRELLILSIEETKEHQQGLL